MPGIINLNNAGSDPEVVLNFKGITFCEYFLYIRAKGQNNWIEFYSGSNKMISNHRVILDPIALKVGSTVGDFSGWQFGWWVTYYGNSNRKQESFDLTVDIVQDGFAVTNQFHKRDTFTAPVYSLSDDFKIFQ